MARLYLAAVDLPGQHSSEWYLNLFSSNLLHKAGSLSKDLDLV